MTIQKTARRNTALIFFILGIFMLAGVGAYLYTIETKVVQAETDRVADESANTIRANVRTLFRDLRTFSELGHLASLTTNGSVNATISAFLQDLGTPFLHLGSTDSAGHLIYTYDQQPTRSTDLQQIINEAQKQLFQTIQSTKTFAVSDPVTLPTGESALLFATPIVFNDTTSGMAYGVIPVSYFYRSLETTCSETGYRFSILLPQGLITQSPDSRCVVEPETTTTRDLRWLHAIRTLRVANGTWEISVLNPSNSFQLTDIPSFLPFVAGGIFIITIITVLLYHIEQQRHLLERALAREDEFVSIVSHQLREPVSQMNATLELLEETWPSCAQEKAREFVEDLHAINQSNARLISNLLNVSRLQRGVLKPQIQHHVLKTLLEQALKKTEAERHERQVTVHVRPAGFASMVKVDENFAGVVIQNILDNAAKYGPDGSEISIKADTTSRPSFVVLSIADKGPGIPKPLQQTLFSREKSRDAKTSGTGAGLGLYIAKSFMTMLGGDIWFKTSSKGTTFYLAFPKATA